MMPVRGIEGTSALMGMPIILPALHLTGFTKYMYVLNPFTWTMSM